MKIAAIILVSIWIVSSAYFAGMRAGYNLGKEDQEESNFDNYRR